jgi:hypothetical protein
VTVYVDSSIVLRHILNSDSALGVIGPSDIVGSSDLLVIECQRVLQRERMAGHLNDQQYAEAVGALDSIVERLFLIELGPAVKQRAAGSFPTVVGTLDAIHLASAILWGQGQHLTDLRVLTVDRQLAICARSVGLQVIGER